ALDASVEYTIGKTQSNTGIISIPDSITGEPTFYNNNPEAGETDSWKEQVRKSKEGIGIEGKGRASKKDYYKYYNTLDRVEYDTVMEYDRNVSEDQKQKLYRGYQEDKRKADNIGNAINYESV